LCVCVCVCVCLFVCLCVCVSVYVCGWVGEWVGGGGGGPAYTWTRIHTCMRLHIHFHTDIHMHIHIHRATSALISMIGHTPSPTQNVILLHSPILSPLSSYSCTPKYKTRSQVPSSGGGCATCTPLSQPVGPTPAITGMSGSTNAITVEAAQLNVWGADLVG
jgi:hypothetical protein